MGVEISRGLLVRVLAHAASEPKREVCGLLLAANITVRAERSRGTPPSAGETALGSARSDPSTTLGANGEGKDVGSQRVTGIIETFNVSPNPADSFEIDPTALFAALRAERAGGSRLIGHYHSHPNGLATPSERDAMMATSSGRLWLIVAAGEARLWREVPGGAVQGAFEPVELLTDGADEGCA